jgi:hypothetical protein
MIHPILKERNVQQCSPWLKVEDEWLDNGPESLSGIWAFHVFEFKPPRHGRSKLLYRARAFVNKRHPHAFLDLWIFTDDTWAFYHLCILANFNVPMPNLKK